MNKQKIIAGIDVGSSKITTIIASLLEEEVKIIGVSSIPSDGVRKSQIVNIEEAAETIISSVESAERMAGYHLSRVLVSVGGQHLESQNSRGVVAVAEPEREISKDDVDRVIEAARAISLSSSREVIHVIPRSFTVDGQEGIKDPIGMSGIRLEVETHIVTASSTAVRNLAKCVAEMGADVQNLVASGLVSAEAVLTPTEKELGVISVDIGGGTTSVTIFIEGSPFYTAVLPIGAKYVTNDLAIGLRLSLESAEKIKLALSGEKLKKIKLKTKFDQKEKEVSKENEDELNLGQLGLVEEKRTVSRKTLENGIIRARLNEIFNMVTIEVRKSGAGGLTPAGVVVSGGGAMTVGIVEAAKKILSMPVRVGYPKGVSGLIDDIQTPDFATAVGLVIYGSKQETLPMIGFSFGRIGKRLRSIPVGGVASRVTDLIKSFLP